MEIVKNMDWSNGAIFFRPPKMVSPTSSRVIDPCFREIVAPKNPLGASVICLSYFDIQTPKQHVGSNSVIMSFYLTDLRDKHHGNTNTNNYI